MELAAGGVLGLVLGKERLQPSVSKGMISCRLFDTCENERWARWMLDVLALLVNPIHAFSACTAGSLAHIHT